MEDLKIQATLIEEKIKISREEENFNEITQLHLQAAKIYQKLDNSKNYAFHCANYYSNKANINFFDNDYKNAKKNSKLGEKKFLNLEMIDPAFHCSKRHLQSLHNLAKEDKNIKSKYYQEFIEEAEIFFERYKSFSDDFRYIKSNIIYNYLKSRNYRIEGKLELAEVWSKKSYELAQIAYEKFKNDSLKIDYILNLKMYCELKAKRLEKEHEFIEASEYYEKAAVIISTENPSESYNLYIRHHRCLALANKFNSTVFIENIDKAIKYASKRNDENQINYLMGFKFENLIKFSQNLEEKIELLSKAKEYFFKAEDKDSGQYMEYLLSYYSSKRELMNGNYEDSIRLLERAISYSNLVYFPNIVSSESILKNELLLHKFYLLISNGEFNKSNEIIKNWLECRKDIIGTNKHVFYNNLSDCCQKLSQSNYSDEDLDEIEELKYSIRTNRLGKTLYNIASLTYCHVSLKINEIDLNEVYESIKLNIIRLITTDEAANYVKKSLDVQTALEKREWLYRLPSSFAEKFDDCIFLLNDITEGYHYMVYKEFYKLIENYLKIIIEFNGKKVWHEHFEDIIKEKINTDKDFSNFTFGDYNKALEIIKDEDDELFRELTPKILELLNYHIEKRNQITHEEKFELDPSNDILQDTTEILLGLLNSFPIIIKVTDSKRKPWYDIEIQWNSFPRKISLYADKDLYEDREYYLEPTLEIIDNGISPQVIISK